MNSDLANKSYIIEMTAARYLYDRYSLMVYISFSVSSDVRMTYGFISHPPTDYEIMLVKSLLRVGCIYKDNLLFEIPCNKSRLFTLEAAFTEILSPITKG